MQVAEKRLLPSHPLPAEPVPVAQGSVRLPALTDLPYAGMGWFVRKTVKAQSTLVDQGPREWW